MTGIEIICGLQRKFSSLISWRENARASRVVGDFVAAAILAAVELASCPAEFARKLTRRGTSNAGPGGKMPSLHGSQDGRRHNHSGMQRKRESGASKSQPCGMPDGERSPSIP